MGAEEEAQFPRSLKVRQLSVKSSQGFSWESLNNPLGDNLVSLEFFGRGFDLQFGDLAFKSLKKLNAHSVDDSEIHMWNDFLRRHSSINSLSIGGCYGPVNRLPLKIDSLHNLETLRLYNMPVDTESGNIQRVPLKSLRYAWCSYPTKFWTTLSNTLETLDIVAVSISVERC